MGDNNWTRRDFIKGIGATTTGIALSSCGISGDRSAKGLTEEALAVQPVVRSQDLEKSDLTVGYVPVNDCAPFAIAWKKGFFRKYGLNVTLNRGSLRLWKINLLKIVAVLEKATSGLVRLDGQEIRQPGAERMVVFQNYSLLPWLTVRENIRLAVDEVLKNANRAEKISIVNQHLAMVNLMAAADKYPDEISGGMKQRVGIARVAIQPKMLLMDEPFGALDVLTRGKLERQVLDIWENNRQAVMMITHDVDEAIYMSDRIVLMTNGLAANIGEILEVPFKRPRVSVREASPSGEAPQKEARAAMRNSKEYFEFRNYALNFLDRYFAQDE